MRTSVLAGRSAANLTAATTLSFVHVKPRAAGVENVHGPLRHPCCRRRAPLDQSLNNALPDLAVPGATGVLWVLRFNYYNTRARSHHRNHQPLGQQPAYNARGSRTVGRRSGGELIPASLSDDRSRPNPAIRDVVDERRGSTRRVVLLQRNKASQ